MSGDSLLWIQVGVGSFLVALFLWRNRQRQPTRLKLRHGIGDLGESSAIHPKKAVVAKTITAVNSTATATRISDEALGEAFVGHEKSLNVLFNYNGHTWDAYEILGIPAGASSALVDSAYKNLRAKTAPESLHFIECAYQSIKSSQRRTS